MPVEDTALRGSGSAAHTAALRLPTGWAAALKEWVKACLDGNTTPVWVCRSMAQGFLREEFGVIVSRNKTGELLRAAGCAWGQLEQRPKGTTSPLRLIQRRFYAIQLSLALKDGDILLASDESYANVRAVDGKSWAVAGEAYSSAYPSGVGDRCCFINVLGEDGLLVERVPDGPGKLKPHVAATGDVDTVLASGEMMFGAKKGEGDYHGNFDSAIFLKWVRNRLIPALKYFYPPAFGPNPTRRISIILDNAPYHVTTSSMGITDLRFDPLTTPRDALVAKMNTAGCHKLTVAHAVMKEGAVQSTVQMAVTLDAAEATRKGVNGKVARLPELQAAALAWLAQHKPDRLMNDVEYLLASAGNVRVIWNAPVYPDGNPIEMVWSRAKAYAKMRYVKNRSFARLIDDVRAGMYTAAPSGLGFNVKGGDFLRDINTGKCKPAADLFRHVIDHPSGGLQAIIDNDGQLGGTARNLQAPAATVQLARASFTRAVLRWLTAEAVGVGGDGGGADAADSDEEVDGEGEV